MELTDTQVLHFQQVIKESSEYDFSNYSINSLKRRLQKIQEDSGSSFDSLVDQLKNDAFLLEEIIKKITVHTTELFRDTLVWQQLLNRILLSVANKEAINIWHAGCSTGQEVYSMMIVLDQLNMLDKANIYASDLNPDVLEKARSGNYSLRFHNEYIANFNKVFNVKPEDKYSNGFSPMEKYFTTDASKDEIKMQEFLREKPVYKRSDLVKDENIFNVTFDIIMCRNVIIYFNYELQNKVLQLFHRNLKDEGCLILGKHESIIGPCSRLYENEEHFYRKQEYFASES